MQQGPLLQENLYRLNMTTTFGQRLKLAREFAALTQSGLARSSGLNVRPQNIQYLEDPANKAEGSQYTASLAKACGVDPLWLERGVGEMTPGAQTREPRALSDKQITSLIANLDPDMRRAVVKILQRLGDTPPGARVFPLGADAAPRLSDRSRAMRTVRKT